MSAGLDRPGIPMSAVGALLTGGERRKHDQPDYHQQEGSAASEPDNPFHPISAFFRIHLETSFQLPQ
jgi:hypothetical protein